MDGPSAEASGATSGAPLFADYAIPQLESQGSIDSTSESRNLLRGSSITAQSHVEGGPSRRTQGGIAADWSNGKSPLGSCSRGVGSKWDIVRLDIFKRVRFKVAKLSNLQFVHCMSGLSAQKYLFCKMHTHVQRMPQPAELVS